MIAVVCSALSSCFRLASSFSTSTRNFSFFLLVETLLIPDGKNRVPKDNSNALFTALRRDDRGILRASTVDILRQRIFQTSRQFNVVNLKFFLLCML
jgi:hypothetical protein